MAFSCASSPCDPLPPFVRSLCIHVQLSLDIFQYRGETHKGIWASHTERKKSFFTPRQTLHLEVSFQCAIGSYRRPKKYEIIFNFSIHQVPFASKAGQIAFCRGAHLSTVRLRILVTSHSRSESIQVLSCSKPEGVKISVF